MDENEQPEPAALEAESQPAARRSPVWAVVAGAVAVVLLAVVIGVTVSGGSKSKSHPEVGAAESGLHLVRGYGGMSGTGAAAMPFAPMHYVLDAPLPDLGNHAAAYRLDAPPIDVATMQHYAQVLGINGPVQAGGPKAMSVTDGDAHLVVLNGAQPLFSYSTGVISSSGSGGVVSGVIGSTGDTSSTLPPTTSNAQNVATDTLQKLGVLGDMSDWKVSADGNAVVFARLVNGVPVTGDEWRANVLDDGTISYIEGTLGTPVSIGDVAIRPINDVWHDVENGTYLSPGARPLVEGAVGAPITVVPLPAQSTPASSGPNTATTPAPPSFDVHITGATLGLALWPTTDSTSDLVPTYRFAEKDGGEIEALALTDAAFGPPTTVVPTTLGSIGTLPTNIAVPPKVMTGVEVIARLHVPPGTNANASQEIRVELGTPQNATAPLTMGLSVKDGATARRQVAPGHYFVNTYVSGPRMNHAEAQFDAQNRQTVYLDITYGTTQTVVQVTSK
jgi:hypothetical protein